MGAACLESPGGLEAGFSGTVLGEKDGEVTRGVLEGADGAFDAGEFTGTDAAAGEEGGVRGESGGSAGFARTGGTCGF